MLSLLGVPVDAAYHVVTAISALLTPVAGGLAVAAAIIVFTIAVRLIVLPFSYYALRGQVAQARIAPQAQALRQRYARQPERLSRELTALYRDNGTSMFAGCLPLLLQWPFLSVMYLLFRSTSIGRAPNGLLAHSLFAAQLGSHWLGGTGPLSAQGAVFAALFLLLAVIGALAARASRRFTPPTATPPTATVPAGGKPPAGGTAPAGGKPTATPPTATPPTATVPAGGKPPAGGRAPADGAPMATVPAGGKPLAGGAAAAQPAGVPSWVTSLLPYLTAVFAAFLPLAAGLYLLTTTAWTLAERSVLRRIVLSASAPAGAGPGVPH